MFKNNFSMLGRFCGVCASLALGVWIGLLLSGARIVSDHDLSSYTILLGPLPLNTLTQDNQSVSISFEAGLATLLAISLLCALLMYGVWYTVKNRAHYHKQDGRKRV